MFKFKLTKKDRPRCLVHDIIIPTEGESKKMFHVEHITPDGVIMGCYLDDLLNSSSSAFQHNMVWPHGDNYSVLTFGTGTPIHEGH